MSATAVPHSGRGGKGGRGGAVGGKRQRAVGDEEDAEDAECVSSAGGSICTFVPVLLVQKYKY